MKRTMFLTFAVALVVGLVSCGHSRGPGAYVAGTGQYPTSSPQGYPLGGYYPGQPLPGMSTHAGTAQNRTGSEDPRNWDRSQGVQADGFVLFPMTPSGLSLKSDTGPYLPLVPNYALEVHLQGTSTVVSVAVVDAQDWTGASFHLLFDPAVYDPTLLMNDGFLGSNAEVICLAESHNTGYVSVSVGRFGYLNPNSVSGSGPLVTLTFMNRPCSVPQGQVRWLNGSTMP